MVTQCSAEALTPEPLHARNHCVVTEGGRQSGVPALVALTGSAVAAQLQLKLQAAEGRVYLVCFMCMHGMYVASELLVGWFHSADAVSALALRIDVFILSGGALAHCIQPCSP